MDIFDRGTDEFIHILKDPDDFIEEDNSFRHQPTQLFEDTRGDMWIV